ncbi:MAG: exosortase system-associated protein, TIGR04073 family [Candidatus Omnitrophica bacterium]|nr:exosortase system-associated protein, TIGR04073 family [Candidatus Omnitrophota bacterium]MDD5671243.1 exosortase system-associated protein, TIGR04073 family [Candidatus Omnitrophota bacterium]
MKHRPIISAFFAATIILGASLCPAQVSADDQWTKLGRGICNLSTGLFEVVYQPYEMGKTERWLIAATGGVGKGLALGTARTFVGLYEIFTFPFGGASNYQPIILPEFVVPPAYPPVKDWPHDYQIS